MSSVQRPGEEGPSASTPSSVGGVGSQPLQGSAIPLHIRPSPAAVPSPGASLQARSVRPTVDVDRVMTIQRHHPFEELGAVIQQLDTRIQRARDYRDHPGESGPLNWREKEDQPHLADFQVISEALHQSYEELEHLFSEGERRPGLEVIPEAAREALLDAGIVGSQAHMTAGLIASMCHYRILETPVQPALAARQLIWIKALADAIRNRGEAYTALVVLAAQAPGLRQLWEAGLPEWVFRSPEGKEVSALYVRNLLGNLLLKRAQQGEANSLQDIKSIEEIPPSVLLSVLRGESGLEESEQAILNAMAVAVCPRTALTAPVSQPPEVMAMVLYRLNIFHKISKSDRLRREAENIKKAFEWLESEAQALDQPEPGESLPPGEVPLPVLMLRHVLYEHTLLLLRRALEVDKWRE